MFTSAGQRLDVGFAEARVRLAGLASGGFLRRASGRAYDEGVAGLARAGPAGPVPGMSRLVKVWFLDPILGDQLASLPVRWEVAGPGGSAFPALDADIVLVPALGGGTILEISGSYRPPYGALGKGLDRVVMHRVADATLRAFARQVACALTTAATPSAADAARAV